MNLSHQKRRSSAERYLSMVLKLIYHEQHRSKKISPGPLERTSTYYWDRPLLPFLALGLFSSAINGYMNQVATEI
jgi:hypothetical protein